MEKKASILFILRLLKTVLAIVTLSITAKYFGVTIARDQWLLSIGFILVLDGAVWGPVNQTFRARFIFLQHEIGKEESLVKARSMFTFINLITFFLVFVILIFPGLLAKIIAPGYNELQLGHLIDMILLLIPSLLFNQICLFLTSVLNAYDIYFIPEVSGFLASVLNIVIIVFLAPIYGINSLIAGYYLGILILVIFLLINLKRKGIDLIGNPFKFKFNDVKPFLIFAIPFFLPSFFAQSNNILEKSLASKLGVGMVSTIDYSRRFSENLVMVLAGIFTTMLLPVLCKNIANNKLKAFVYSFSSIFQFSIFIMTFMIGILTACPDSITNILYSKGNFGPDSLNRIVMLTRIYSWAEFAVLMFILFGVALISAGKGKTYALFGSLAQVALIVLNVTLIKFMGVYTLPISLLVSHIVIAVILFNKFPVTSVKFKIMIYKGVLQILVCSSILYLINYTLIEPSIKNPYIILVINTVVLGILMLVFIILVKTEVLRTLNKLALKFRKYISVNGILPEKLYTVHINSDLPDSFNS